MMILYFSRLREFYADRFAGSNIRPLFLANALAKITYKQSTLSRRERNSMIRAFYAVDPITSKYEVEQFSAYYSDLNSSNQPINNMERGMQKEKSSSLKRFSEIFRTHPLTYKRIEKLYDLEKEWSQT